MYEVDSDKFTSKPDPKKEFAQYLKDSGAAAAMQKAMVLLYRMPVKPTNLTEFFSQYFENGAQQLMRISLLKAELCYKRDELQSRRLKVQESENQIKEMVDRLGISDEEFNRRFVPERIKEKNRLSILERYFKDMESRVLRKPHERESIHSIVVDPKIELKAARSSNYDWKNDCVRNGRFDNVLRDDIKELDPWGIICKPAKGGGEQRQHSLSRDHDDTSHAEEGNEQDDDDATSLAELFQQSSRDWVIQEQDENAAKLRNRLLMVRNADKIKMVDFMGWTPLQSREKLIREREGNLQKTHFFDNNVQGIENLKRRPCSQIKAEMPVPLSTATNADANPPDFDNDAFLLDENHLDHVYKMIETTQESFDYEFKRYLREPRKSSDEICEPLCDLTDLERICSTSVDSIHDEAMYGEDEYEDSLNESFTTGKMRNWTNKYIDYPSCSTAGEYYDEFSGENMYACDGRDSAPVSCQNSKVPPEIPLTRIDSSCHCLFTGVYDTKEMLSENIDEKGEEPKAPTETSFIGKPHSRGGRLSKQKDEITLTEESVLENELQEVFKEKRGRKSNPLKEIKDEETHEPVSFVDVFGIDLAKEVKRTMLGIKPSEPNYFLAAGTGVKNATLQFPVTRTLKSNKAPFYFDPKSKTKDELFK